jgi:hypothetical protein
MIIDAAAANSINTGAISKKEQKQNEKYTNKLVQIQL